MYESVVCRFENNIDKHAVDVKIVHYLGCRKPCKWEKHGEPTGQPVRHFDQNKNNALLDSIDQLTNSFTQIISNHLKSRFHMVPLRTLGSRQITWDGGKGDSLNKPPYNLPRLGSIISGFPPWSSQVWEAWMLTIPALQMCMVGRF